MNSAIPFGVDDFWRLSSQVPFCTGNRGVAVRMESAVLMSEAAAWKRQALIVVYINLVICFATRGVDNAAVSGDFGVDVVVCVRHLK